MTGTRTRRAADAGQALVAGAVLLAYWSTVALFARWCVPPRPGSGESVRRKA
ncbi:MULTISPECIES: hypothetical protein [unclassified Streptomyces]|uniref:hypothetical protein n=1 Tax=unclassified Streptomyces TaxID=2593676 RepID=UPI00036F4880|nr:MULTISPECIES: hypothetical protein [unclassified Streptomyces]MYY05681.1 hypothetical protein [Streptomyces sp. SID4913]